MDGLLFAGKHRFRIFGSGGGGGGEKIPNFLGKKHIFQICVLAAGLSENCVTGLLVWKNLLFSENKKNTPPNFEICAFCGYFQGPSDSPAWRAYLSRFWSHSRR